MALYEVIFTGTYYAQLWQNRFHLESVEGFVGDAQTIANALNTDWVFQFRGNQVSDVVWSNINVKRLSAPFEQHILPIGLTGAHAGEPQRASFIAGVMQKKTGLAGKQNRGRFYIPGIRGGGTQGGLIVGNELTFWTSACNVLKSKFIDPLPHNVRLVIKHEEGSTPVTSLVMRQVLGCIRTRNIGVGS